jgi:uroporphyrinogen-III synthase
MSARPALAGVGVLITRPREQAAAMAARIVAMGGTAVVFPAIEIAAPLDPALLQTRIAHLAEFDLVVFVSPNAVTWALPLFVAHHPDWPRGCRVAAVGQGTRRVLSAQGITEVLTPRQEAGGAGLLDLPELAAPAPRQVLIVRGAGGRDDLAQGLAARGARVEYAECYRRLRPEADSGPIIERWRRCEIDAVIVTSGEILDNLADMLGAAGAPFLRATPMFVHHPRIAQAARARGISTVIDAGADGDALIEALAKHFAHHD